MIKRKPTEVPRALKNIDAKAILRKRGIYLKQRINQEMKEAARPLAKEILKKKVVKPKTKAEVQKYSGFSNEQVQAYCEKQIHLVHVIESKFNLRVEQFIARIVHSFLAHLESEVKNTKTLKQFKTKDFFDDSEDGYLEQAQLDFTPLLESVATLAGQNALDLINHKDVYIAYKYRQQIAANVEKFTRSMLDTDRATLVNIIANGVEQGQSMDEIRNAIKADFDSITKSQADRITNTEVSRASIQAQQDAWQQTGVVEGKEWAIDGADDECAEYDGQIEALDGNFYDDTTEFADGDPPLHPNCKCQLLPVLLNE